MTSEIVMHMPSESVISATAAPRAAIIASALTIRVVALAWEEWRTALASAASQGSQRVSTDKSG